MFGDLHHNGTGVNIFYADGMRAYRIDCLAQIITLEGQRKLGNMRCITDFSQYAFFATE